jgi:hypothetical protein
VELTRVSNMFSPGDLKDIIYKMNLSGVLSKLLNGIVQTMYGLIEEASGKFEIKVRRLESQLKTTERKLINLSKLITNNRMKSKTERTRMRHLSVSSKY